MKSHRKEKELYNVTSPASERGRSKVPISAPFSFMLPLLIFGSASGYDASLTGSSIQKKKVVVFFPIC